MELFRLLGTIAVNGSEAEREIDGVTNSAQGAESRLSKMVGTASNIGKAVAKGAAVVSAAVVGVGVASLKAGEQANQTLGAIAAQTGQTQGELRGTEKAVRRLASTTGAFTAQEMRNGLIKVSRYGQDAEHQTALLNEAMRLAQASGNAFGKSIYALDALLVKFNKDVSYASKFTNLFATAQGKAGISTANMLKGMQRIAPTVNAAGLSYEFVAAAMSQAYLEGINVTNSSNGLANIFLHMLDPASDMASVMEDLGISAFYASGEMRDQETVMQELIRGLDGMSDYARGAAMAYMGLSQYGIAMLDMLSESNKEVSNLSDAFAYGMKAGDEYGRVLHMIDQRSGGFTEGFQRMRNMLRNVLYSINDVIGSRFYEWMGEAATKLEGFISHAKENGYIEQMAESIISIVEAAVNLTREIIPIVVEWLPKLINLSLDITQFLGENAEVVIALWAAFKGYKILKPVIGIFGGLKKATIALKGKKAIGGLAPAMGKAVGAKGGKGVLGGAGKLLKALGPKGWAVAAIGAGTVAAIRYTNNQKQAINADFEDMYIHTGSKSAAMAYTMAQNMGRMSEDAQTKMSELMRNHYDVFDAMYAETGDKSKAMSAVVSKYFDQQKNDVRRELREVELASRDTWLKVYEETGDRTKATQAVVDAGYQDMKRDMQRNLRALEAEYRYYGEALPAGMETGLRRGSPSVFTAVGDFAHGVAERFRSFFGINSPSRLLDKYGQGMGQGLNNGMLASQSMVNLAATNMSKGIENVFNRMPNQIQTIGRNSMSKLKSQFSSNMPGIQMIIRNGVNNMTNTLSGLQGSFSSLGRNAMNGLNVGLNAGRGAVMNTARSIANDVTRTMRNALQINSPSRKIAKMVGEPIMEGKEKGMLDKFKDVERQARSLSAKLIDSLQVNVPQIESRSLNTVRALSKVPSSNVAQLNLPTGSATDNRGLFEGAIFNWYGKEDIRETMQEIAWVTQTEEGRLY